MRRCFVVVLCAGITGGMLSAQNQNEKTAPKEADSTGEILKAIDKIKGFGVPASARFRRQDQQMFFVWYCPYSGRAACHFYGYAFDGKKEKWIRFLDRVFEGAADVSVEVGRGLRVRDMKGSVVYEDKGRE